MSSSFGNNVKISIFGESHSRGIGVTIDGIPAGYRIDMEELQAFLDRRAPGRGNLTTQRKESDRPEFLSGIQNGITCGSPISAVIRNRDTRSGDYDEIRRIPRPGHADFTARVKYDGFEDYRGGGHFSGRLTAPLCIAGGIIKQILETKGIRIRAEITEIGGIPVSGGDRNAALQEVEKAKEEEDSVGGIITCTASGIPAGIGDPMFDGVENRIAACVFAIPAVKGIEFGRGFAASRLRGSENNDSFYFNEEGTVRTKTNNAGGILGGITNGMPVTFRTAFKPTPSIAREQDSIEYETGKNVKLKIRGRHDPCIVLRAEPCVESACAVAIYDLMLEDLRDHTATNGGK